MSFQQNNIPDIQTTQLTASRHSGFYFWGHRIVYQEEEVRCRTCEESYEIPDLVQGSLTDHQKVIYKIYLLKNFKYEECIPAGNEKITGNGGTLEYITKNTHNQRDNRKF